MADKTSNRSDRSERSVPSDRSVRSKGQNTLRVHGGYRKLHSFQVTEAVYDGTVAFCGRFIPKTSRTHDQMVQAARSGRQNIAEGSRASGTSSQIELRLVGVARASLDELLLDYEDFLRQRSLCLWSKNDPRAMQVRQLSLQTDLSDRTDRSETVFSPYRALVEEGTAEVSANTLICLIHQANYLLDRQIQSLEKSFIQGGGYSEQLAAARLRQRKEPTDRTDPTYPPDSLKPAPSCSVCIQPMILRTARKGRKTGSQFWGCSHYPDCKETLPL